MSAGEQSSHALADARWITAGTVEGPLPLFRRAFDVPQRIRTAVIAICGLGQYELLINGRKVGDDVLTPGWTDYRKTCLYNVHDVTAMLAPGRNALGVMLGNGMYNVAGGRYRKFKGSFGPPKLIARLEIAYEDGTRDVIVTDEAWKTISGPIVFSSIYGGEDYDARLEPAEWAGEAFEDSDWQPASICDGPGGVLIEQDCPPSRVIRRYEPVAVTYPRPGVRVYDLGQNFSGWPAISVRGRAGTTIKLITGELLDDAGLVSQKNTGSPVSFSYTARGDQVERWHPRFSYTGFRYVQAEGDIDAVIDLRGEFISSASPVIGQFESSNALFNRIHALILAAIASNMQSIFTDCPHREKLGWLEQTHLMGPSVLYNYDAVALYRKICRDMRDAQRPDGCVPTIAPQYTSFQPPWDIFNDSPEWGSALVIAPWMVYQRTGDRRILAENYDAMKRYVEYLGTRADGDGIITYGLGDWYDVGEGEPGFAKLTSPGLTATAIYWQDLDVMRQVAMTLGHDSDAMHFAHLADQTRAAFNARFFNTEQSSYDTGSQTACAMPLALGLVDEAHREAVLEHLLEDIRMHGHITAGDIGHRYVLTALAEAGRSDVIASLLNRTEAPSYGYQIERGATTLTEAWDANPKVSQNHFMLGHAEEWFYAWLAGIQIDLSQPPPRRLVFRPAPVAEVNWVRCRHVSSIGPVTCSWYRKDEALRLEVEVPAGAEAALLYLPGDAADIQLDEGDPIDAHAGVRLLRREGDFSVFELRPGWYGLECRSSLAVHVP